MFIRRLAGFCFYSQQFIATNSHLWHNNAMKFDDLVLCASKQPVFETGLLLAGNVDPADVRRQLSRWTQAGKVVQLRRGVYMLAAPYQQVSPHPFLIANTLLPGSYISLQSALAHYGLIPEYVPRTLSLTTLRPSKWHTPLGDFRFQHIAPGLFFGYQKVRLAGGQEAFVALPEKALLDLIHLTPNGDDPVFLAGLRLQNLENLDRKRLSSLAERAGKPKWLRAASRLSSLIEEDGSESESR
jgi:predicted transcriptional regulator of viral defense system